jgi:hypothetical protein
MIFLIAPRRQERKGPNGFFLGTPFDFAQDMLCAFVRVHSDLVAAQPRRGLRGE